MLLLGTAVGLKTYPLLLIPITALLLSQRNLVSITKLTAVGLIPVALIFGPFLSHDFITRVFHAKDAGSLGSGFHWPLFYVCILALAWVISKDRPDIIRLAAVWLLTLLSIFVLTWWLPQWGVWLLPMVVLLAVRDKWMLWTWIATNAAAVIANFVRFPGNMDGDMLYPLFGGHPGHVYILPASIGGKLDIICTSICWIGLVVLSVRTLQWILWRESVDSQDAKTWIGSSYALIVSLLAPATMVLVVALMVAQNLIHS